MIASDHDGRGKFTASHHFVEGKTEFVANTKATTDESAAKIARDIAQAFEKQLTYPGEIRVTMIRESRFTEMAK